MSSENDEVEKKEQMEEHSDLEEEKEEKEEEEKKKEEEEKEEGKNEETENDETMEEDEKVEDADSSVENDKNSQNELTPTKKTKKSEKNTRKNKRKSSEVEKIKEGENEEKSVKSSKKKKKLVKDKSKEKKDSDEVKKIEIVETDTITKRADWTGYFAKRDHSVNQIYQSEIPQICKDEPCQLGVDEAGRGPVLGPMVYGISFAPLSQKQLLVDMGCADSKSLTEEKRDIIFDKICDNGEKMGYAIDSISPNYIANCMYRRTKTSLNEVSMDSAINLIQMTIDAGVFVKEIYVDTVGKPEKYQLKLELKFPGIKIVVAKKADSTYPIVSAASICAKVSRDHALRAWQFREGENETAYGSGYPNDPATKSWLGDNVDSVFGFPQIVRFSWSTAENILESKAIPVEWEDPEEENVPEDTGPKISSYFLPSPASSKKKEREKHKFFISRCLKNAIEL